MKKGVKIGLVIGGALLVAALSFVAIKKFGAKANAGPDDSAGGDTSPDASGTDKIAENSFGSPSNIGPVPTATPTTTAPQIPVVVPRTTVATNYTKGQRVYARTNSGLYSSPTLRSQYITNQVVKDQPIGMFEKISVNGFAYLTVVLKDASGKYVPMIKYIPLTAIRPANIAKGEKN